MHPARAIFFASAGVKPPQDLVANRRDESRRHRLVDEVDAGKKRRRAAAEELLYRVDDLRRLGHLETPDVGKLHVAERALPPVAATGHHELHPLAAVPQVRDEVVGLRDVEILAPVYALVVGLHERRHIRRARPAVAEQSRKRRISLVELEIVEVPVRATVRHLAELRRDIAAAKQEPNAGIAALYESRDLERRDESPRERACHAYDRRLHLFHRGLESAFEGFVNHPAASYQPLKLAEVGDGAAQVLGVARKAEVGVDLVAYRKREILYGLARPALRLDRRGAAEELEKFARRLVAVFEEHVAYDLYREVALGDVEPARLEEPRQVHRRRIRRIRLQQRRSQKEKSLHRPFVHGDIIAFQVDAAPSERTTNGQALSSARAGLCGRSSWNATAIAILFHGK